MESQKKKYKQIKNSRTEVESGISRSNSQIIRNDLMNFDEYFESFVSEFQFDFKFNEYLRLVLAKILPPRNQEIKILASDKKLKGPSSQCKQLLETIKTEFQSNKMKVIKHNNDEDIDEIQYNIDKSANIYRTRYLQRAIQSVEKHYGFKIDAQSLRKRIKEDTIIMIRIQKSIEKQTLQIIQEILQTRSSELNQTTKSGNTLTKQIDKSIEEEQQSPSFYQIQQNRKVKSIHSEINVRIEADLGDNTSTVSEIKKKKKKYVESKSKENQQTEKRIVIKSYEYTAQNSINIDNFRQWLKRKKTLKPEDVQIQQIKDKFANDTIMSFKISLFLLKSQDPEKKKDEIETYLKFQRVVLVTFENPKYKKDVISKFEQEDMELSVKYVEGYKNPKWPEKSLWYYLKKEQVPKQKKGVLNQKFEAFWLIGLQNLVQNMQSTILEELEKKIKQNSEQQLYLNIDCLSKYRDNLKIISFVDQTVKQLISTNYSEVCTVKDIEYILGGAKVTLIVKFQKLQQFEKFIKQSIIKKAAEDIVYQNYKSDFKLDPVLYASLEKEYVIVQRDQRAFKFVTSLKKISSAMSHIHEEIKILSKISEKELVLSGRVVFNKTHEFIEKILANQNDLKNIKFNCIKNEQKQQYTLKFYGIGYLIEELIAKVNEELKQIKSKIMVYKYEIKKKQAQILNCNREFQETIHKQHDISLTINFNAKISCRLEIESVEKAIRKKTISIIKSNNLDMVPYGSFIYFRSQEQINKFNSYYLLAFKQSFKGSIFGIYKFQEITRNYHLFLIEKSSIDQIIKLGVQENQNNNMIVLIMPKQQKCKFIREIATCLTKNEFFNLQIKIMIVQTHNEDMAKVLDFNPAGKIKLVQQNFTKYYAIEKDNKLYYSANGNKKINDAIKKGLSKVYLFNDDLQISHISHIYNTKTCCLTHIQSNTFIQTTLQFGKINFNLKQMQFQLPFDQYLKVMSQKAYKDQIQLSLGVYEIDLKQMKQINLFSEFERLVQNDQEQIKKQENEQKLDLVNQLVNAYYDINTVEIIYSFSDEGMKNIPTVYREIGKFLSSKLIIKEFDISQYKNMSRDKFMASWRSMDSQQNIECEHLMKQKKIKIKVYDETDIKKAILILEYEKKKQLDKGQIIYPDFWEHQKQDIQTFTVNKQTQEFKRVQRLFTTGKIKQLLRIQNKIIYKKYYEEGLFLKDLNQNKNVNTKELFHGTRQTNPKEIYLDKEESFNINYSSDNNLLGKGIYFAEKSQYSHNYRYVQQNSMFLCSVYVGDSMKCPKHNGAIKDTDYKDKIKKIKYESMTDFLINSNIYVVYKSRRAYPLYLIMY